MNIQTMTLNPLLPLARLGNLQREMTRLFEGVSGMERPPVFPLVNVLTDPNGAVVTAEIPGLDPADLNLSLHEGRLTIQGEVKNRTPESEGTVCHRRERFTGSFSRSFTLPFEVEEENVKAKYDKGVLEIILPRAEKTKPRAIPVIAD